MNQQTQATAAPSTDTATFDRTMLVMDIVERIRADRQSQDMVLADAAEEAALAERVKAAYAAQGMPVSDAIVSEAIRSWRNKRFTFTPLPDGPLRKLADFYIDRPDWLPKARFGAVVLASLLALGLVVSGVMSWHQHSKFLSSIEDWKALRSEVSGSAAALSRHVASVGAAEDFAPKLESLGGLLASVEQKLEPGSSLDPRQLAAKNGRQAGQDALLADLARVQDAQHELTEAQRLWTDIDRQRKNARILSDLGRMASDLRAASPWEEWPPSREGFIRHLDELDIALASSNTDAAKRAGSSLATLSAALPRRTALRRDILRWTDSSAVRSGTSHLDALDAALASGNASQAQAAVSALTALSDALALSYRLRIVQENGEKSAVWRYPVDQGQGVRNYYIIVDALDPSGQPTRIPVRNEETGQIEQVSRFGIRVPERVYEHIRRDKMDNGIIDQNVFGEKFTGNLDPVYAFDVSGGMITRW